MVNDMYERKKKKIVKSQLWIVSFCADRANEVGDGMGYHVRALQHQPVTLPWNFHNA